MEGILEAGSRAVVLEENPAGDNLGVDNLHLEADKVEERLEEGIVDSQGFVVETRNDQNFRLDTRDIPIIDIDEHSILTFGYILNELLFIDN